MNFEQLTYEDHSKTFHVHFSSKYHLIQTKIYDVFIDKKQGTIYIPPQRAVGRDIPIQSLFKVRVL